MPTTLSGSTQSLIDAGLRARSGRINTGNLQETFGTGLTGGVTASVTGNKDVVGVQTNLGTSLSNVGSSEDLLQANNPFLSQEQQNILKRRRGLAAAGGLFGAAVDAAQVSGSNQFLAQNRVAALGRLQAQSAESFNALSDVAGGAFGTLGGAFNPASATGFDAEEFRPLLQTLQDLGYGDEVNAVLANQAGQLATVEGGDIDQQVFGAIQQFIAPELSGEARSQLSQEARRLPARFIAPGETTQGVFAERVAAREGQLLNQFLGQSRQQAGSELTNIIGQRIGELRGSSEQLLLQHRLAQGALARGDTQAVLSADFGFSDDLFTGLGIQSGPAAAPSRNVSQTSIDAATLAARERFTPFIRQRNTATVRSI
jgi:hypothetical protein